MPDAEQDREQQSERCHRFADPLRHAGTHVGAWLQQGQIEHGMCEQHAGNGRHNLGDQVGQRFMAAQLATQAHRKRDGRIEMRAGNRTEQNDQYIQRSSRRSGIGEQGDAVIAVGQLHTHDAGPDHGREQQHGADELGEQPARQRHHSRASNCLTRAEMSSRTPR